MASRTKTELPFAAEVDDINGALDDDRLTPEGAVRCALAEIKTMTFAPEREETMRVELRNFSPIVRELRGKCDALALKREAQRLVTVARKLAGPIEAPRPGDEIAAWALRMQDHGWLSVECDLLERDLKPGERIESFTADDVTTDQRTVTLVDLRARLRPASWTNLDSWNGQFARPRRNVGAQNS